MGRRSERGIWLDCKSRVVMETKLLIIPSGVTYRGNGGREGGTKEGREEGEMKDRQTEGRTKGRKVVFYLPTLTINNFA